MRVGKSVEDLFLKHKANVHFYAQSTLFHEEDIPWPIGKLPNIFTQFRKENEKQTEVRALFELPNDLSDSIEVKQDFQHNDLGIQDTEPDEKSVLCFQGGERLKGI